MHATNLPGVASFLFEGMITSPANTRWLSGADAENLIALPGLHDG